MEVQILYQLIRKKFHVYNYERCDMFWYVDTYSKMYYVSFYSENIIL